MTRVCESRVMRPENSKKARSCILVTVILRVTRGNFILSASDDESGNVQAEDLRHRYKGMRVRLHRQANDVRFFVVDNIFYFLQEFHLNARFHGNVYQLEIIFLNYSSSIKILLLQT